jgi:protein gp37
MASKTSIEWTDYNWNFLRGCSRVSEGCRNCYAEGIAARFSGPGMAYEGLAQMVNGKPRWTGEISYHEDILLAALRWKKPRRVFVNSMSDLFHEKVSDEILDKAFAVMALTPQHTYQILTKRPERMREYFEKAKQTPAGTLRPEFWRRWHVWKEMQNLPNGIHRHFAWGAFEQPQIIGEWPLPNVWLGVSVEDQKTADERIPLLLQTPAAVRWISAEPLLGPVDLNLSVEFIGGSVERYDKFDNFWVVVGGESGPNARPFDVVWARDIVKQSRAAGVPVFVKQIGAKPYSSEGGWSSTGSITVPVGSEWRFVKFKDKKGGDMSEWPPDIQIREFPDHTLPIGRVSACEAAA